MQNNNHYNGDQVRQFWAIGTEINFRPRGYLSGPELRGIITGHIYVNVLIVQCGETTWFVSTNRSTKI